MELQKQVTMVLGSTSNFEVSVKDGMFVLPKDEDSSSSYLALQVIEIKNNYKQFSFTSQDITLYNEKDENYNQFKSTKATVKTKFLCHMVIVFLKERALVM